MTYWHWQTCNDRPYLTCDLLTNWTHGFFTRHFYPQSPAELTEAIAPNAAVYRLKQVHGNTVVTPADFAAHATAHLAVHVAAQVSTSASRMGHLPPYPEADALVSDRPHQAVWTCSADCTPVLIGDVVTGQAAAIHSGWRGTAAAVVPKAIARFQSNGSQLDQLRIALGPAISGAMYQVTVEVADQVVSTLGGTWRDWLGAVLPPVLADPEPGKVRLDVRHTILHQLHQLGLCAEQVAIAPHCTHQEPDLFFSYRRDAQKTVQWSGIVSRAV